MMQGHWIDLGVMEYKDAWKFQLQIHEQVLAGGPDTLLFVEHPPVLTLGAGFHAENLLHTEAEYAKMGITIEPTDRGGDVTYHGPDQLVSYPIFDLKRHGKDLHKWLRDLEETQLLVLKHFGILGRRFPPNTGAWVGDNKVSAIGIKVRKWVSLHGIAMNVENEVWPFGEIVPCGIRGYGVTSLTELTGRTDLMEETKEVTFRAFQEVFDLSLSAIYIPHMLPEQRQQPLSRPDSDEVTPTA